jgi:endonuclease IV
MFKKMFKKQKEAVEKQIAQLQETLKLLEYKRWYYETAKMSAHAQYIIQLS